MMQKCSDPGNCKPGASRHAARADRPRSLLRIAKFPAASAARPHWYAFCYLSGHVTPVPSRVAPNRAETGETGTHVFSTDLMSPNPLPILSAETPLDEAVARLREAGVEIAHVGLVDLFGTLRERRVAVADLPQVFGAGATFANVLPQWDAAEQVFGEGPFGGEPIALDLTSLRPYPFEPRACLLIADYTGPSAALSPRHLLQDQVAAFAARGWDAQAAFECEFIVLDETADSLRESGFARLAPYALDNRCWAGESAATHAGFVADLADTLAAGGVAPLSLGLELGPGCLEATLRHTTPVRAADDQVALKLITKAFCRQRGLTAAFMAQLGAEFPGLSQHVHLSLRDTRSGSNLFEAVAEPGSRLGHFVAGMLALMPEAMPFTHPTPNSYRRIAPGNWAPKAATWAEQNYAAAVRLVTHSAPGCRLEYRLPGADANPYLNLAFVLGAGAWGIDHGLLLPPPYEQGSPDAPAPDGATLPHDLFTALGRLARSEEARAIWGERFVGHLCTALGHEEASLRRHASAAERARYLEII